jgi:flagellar basal body-associated protein FliL
MLEIIGKAAGTGDAIITIVVFVALGLLAVARIGWAVYTNLKSKKAKKSEEVAVEPAVMESLEIVSETYINVIKTLRGEVNKLKEDVLLIGELQAENTKLKEKLEALEKENTICRETTDAQAKEIEKLNRKVKRLEKARFNK